MRVRRYVGWLLLSAAVVCLLAGAATAVVFGPDDLARTGPHALDTTEPVVASAPGAIGLAGPTVRVTATLPANRPVFLGLGNSVDVTSYVDGVALTRVDDVSLPWRLETSDVPGDAGLPAVPTTVDWWLASSAGTGEAVIATKLPDERSSLLVAALGDGSLDGLEVTVSYQVAGAFGVGLGLVGLAIGLAMFGLIARRAARHGESDPPSERPTDRSDAERDSGSMQRITLVAVLGAVLLAGTGCAVPHRVSGEPTKLAASPTEATGVVERWARHRVQALRRLDPAPLRAVEDEAILAVDEGAFEVARLLLVDDQRQLGQDLRLEAALSPEVAAYPLWFLAIVADGGRDVSKVQVYRRSTATEPWQLTAQAEILSETQLPELATDGSGSISALTADDVENLAAAPAEVAAAYTALLDDRSASGNETVLVDSFVQQMRSVAQTLSLLEGAGFHQSWSLEDVDWTVATEDGGALVFTTLARTDRYEIDQGTTVQWPAASEQQAYLAGRDYRSATLEYLHQVLLYLPPQGGGPARALGQFGGVVRGDGR